MKPVAQFKENLRIEVCEMPGEPRALTSAYWFLLPALFQIQDYVEDKLDFNK